jgi:hypothetical protein
MLQRRDYVEEPAEVNFESERAEHAAEGEQVIE